MDVTFDAHASAVDVPNPFGASPYTFGQTMTVGASGTALVAYISVESNTFSAADLFTVTGATWNGTAMVLIASGTTSDGLESYYVFGLANPTTGTQTLAFTYTGGTPGNCVGFIDAFSFSNTDLTNSGCFPAGDVSTDVSTTSGTSYPASAFSIATNNGDALVIAMAGNFNTKPSGVSSGTFLGSGNATFRGCYGLGYVLASGNPTTDQFTGTSAGNVAAGAAFRIAKAAVATLGIGGSASLFAPKMGPRRRPFNFRPRLAFSATAHVFAQTVTVNCATSATFGKSTAKSIAIACAGAVSLVKNTAKALAVACTTTTTLTALKVILKTITVGCASAVTMTRSTGKIVAATCVSAVSLVKSVAKSIAVACTTSTTANAIKVILKTITVGCSTTVSLVKSTSKVVAVACSGTVTYTKAVAHSIAVGCVSAVALVKSTGKRVTVACTTSTTASALRVFLKTITVGCSSTVTMSRSVAKNVAVACSGTVTATKAIAKTIAVVCASVLSFLGSFIPNAGGVKIRSIDTIITTGSAAAIITTGSAAATVTAGTLVAIITE